MKRNVYVIRDAVVGYGTPCIDINDAAAKRNFAYAINNNGDTMTFSPKDYDLFKLGSFDHDTGKFELLDVPELVVSGISVFNAE